MTRKLSPDEVERIAREHPEPCAECAPLAFRGWESFPGDRSDAVLEPVGALWLAGQEDEPTLEEHHPAGTSYWSAEAPIALAWFPANRSEVWRCRRCGHGFLRYTEYGGYYEDRRIRSLQPALIVK
jgi:hypothetical protein